MTTAANLASGKDHRTENFPVASVLLKPAYRAPIMTFYRFARTADDIADHPTASPDEKLRRLRAMRRGLEGASGSPEASALADAMAARGIDAAHAHDLLAAFEQDVTVRRYASVAELMDYCARSAMPVGRYVLDVHGENRACWPASDALCAALQIINHLQDCGDDYRELDRVYLPAETLAAAGAQVEELAAPAASPALRAAIVALTDRARALLAESAGFAGMIRDRRLSAEVAIIQRLAEDLSATLLVRDPLSQAVHHSKPRAAWLAAGAVLANLFAKARA